MTNPLRLPPLRPLNDNERLDWLRLSRTDRVGPITFRHLLATCGTVAQALEALPTLARRGGGTRPLTPPPRSKVAEEVECLSKMGGQFVAWCEPEYPRALASVEDAPPVLAVRGHTSLLAKPQTIGIVGARNASLNGRKMAENLAADLGKQGCVIISGLARGIDTAAHSASLETGTIAVLAGGVDMVYPEENRALYNKIMETGCIVSDQPVGSEPRAQMFPRRNRIISGLSMGVIVVEAAKQSGSLITARVALEQGREVFAVPGSPLDPRAGGSNDLLRQGATLVETAEDVLRQILPLMTKPKVGMGRDNSDNGAAGGLLFENPALFTAAPTLAATDEATLTAARDVIIEHLGYSPVAINELVRRTNIAPAVVMTVLLELELAGRLERQAGNQVVLVG